MVLLLYNKINQTDTDAKVIVNWSLTTLKTNRMQVWTRKKASQYIAFL